jgi:hypothetical protein
MVPVLYDAAVIRARRTARGGIEEWRDKNYPLIR